MWNLHQSADLILLLCPWLTTDRFLFFFSSLNWHLARRQGKNVVLWNLNADMRTRFFYFFFFFRSSSSSESTVAINVNMMTWFVFSISFLFQPKNEFSNIQASILRALNPFIFGQHIVKCFSVIHSLDMWELWKLFYLCSNHKEFK